ncbi:MAG TPA: hypothetical protein VFB92_13965 [Vicinamibacterales bacterium]|nr:hypothetical protein [Vicinamibacterales bacterium]
MSLRTLGVCAVLAGLLSSGVRAQDMPDPSLIHGRAIPAQELANGTVTVRVVREAIGNNVPGQQVSVTVGGTTRTATTDAQGRAEFTDLPKDGANAIAEVTVDGETLVSQPFAVPTSGGLRVILVAGIAKAAERKKQEEAAAAAQPPTKGIVVLGGNSRVLMQFNNDALDVYYILEIVNSARTRVDTGGPLVIDLPRGATGATALEGSSKTATVTETKITVAGPFASGTTTVQAAFRMPYSGGDLTMTQTWPVAFQQVIVGVQKVGDLRVASPQLTQTSDVRTENGDLFVLGNGPALPAGGTLTLTLSGLPFHNTTPRYVTLAIAAGLLAFGAWLAVSGRTKKDETRQALVARRDTLLGQLAQLESKRRAGTVDGEAQAKRRTRILGELEQIYGELDEAHPGPQGGGEGIAA